jgi:hypothetical protein
MDSKQQDSRSPGALTRRIAGRLMAVSYACTPRPAMGLAPASADALTPPNQDSFHTPPRHLANRADGTILRARQVSLSGAAQSKAAAAYQLLFRTTSATGHPTAAVTTVLVPTSPAPGRRVLATYEPAYDSLTLNCAPSYTLQDGNGGGGSTATFEDGLIATELAEGWDVNVPDYEGLKSEWAVGPMLGRASLDSVRAAEHFAADGLTARQHDEGHLQRLLGRLRGSRLGRRTGTELRTRAQHRRHRRGPTYAGSSSGGTRTRHGAPA